jgi:hypothetical protein
MNSSLHPSAFIFVPLRLASGIFFTQAEQPDIFEAFVRIDDAADLSY